MKNQIVPKRIVVDGRWIKATGIGRYIENTLREILKLDNVNQYLLLVRDVDVPKLDLKADNLIFVPVNIDWYTTREQTLLLKKINDLKPDLVHFTNFNLPLGYKGRFVVTIHDLTLLKFKNVRRKFAHRYVYAVKEMAMRLTLRTGVTRSKAIIVPTEYVKDGIAKYFKVRRSKIFVTYQAASQDVAVPRVNLEKYGIDKPYIMYAGNAYPHKNLERLIVAFGKLVTQYLLDYQLVIVGKKDSFHKELEREVADAKLKKRIIFTDFVSDQELAGLYNKASLYVFPSLSEGFGLPALEAMSHGVPVASSNATCLPEVLGDAAVYFDPHNPAKMAKVIADVLSDAKLREGLIKKGILQVKKYSWQKTAKQTLAVYQKALQSR